MNWPIHFSNEFSFEVLECSPNDLVAEKVSLGHLIDRSERDMVWNSVQSALANKEPYQLIYHIKTPENNQRVVFEQGHGVFTNDNQFIELNGFISDITDIFSVPTQYTIENHFKILNVELRKISEIKSGYQIRKNHLSHREIQIYVYFCQGMAMKEIGNILNISHRTVEGYITKIKWKMLCSTSSELRKIFFTTKAGRMLVSMM